jgi:hypothetical protein
MVATVGLMAKRGRTGPAELAWQRLTYRAVAAAEAAVPEVLSVAPAAKALLAQFQVT